MIFLAFAFGLWLGVRRGKPEGIDSNTTMDFVVWMMISSLIGARLAYVFAHWSEYAAHPLDMISPFQSDGSIGVAGLVVLGGVATAVPTAYYFARKRSIPFWKLVDVMMPSLAFGMAIGRIGCHLNGCCFGLPTELPWGIVFPKGSLAAMTFPGLHIHPTQAYDFLYNIAIGLILIWFTPRRRYEGELFALFMLLYGLNRIWVEAVRYYEPSLVPVKVWGVHITGSMVGSALMIALGLFLLLSPQGRRLKRG